VAEFTDARKTDDPLVIGHVIEKNGTKVLVLPKYIRPTDAVARGVRAYLRKAGYNVSGVGEKWDLQEQSISKAANGKILIGGAIEEMEINCRRALPANTYTTRIKLTVYLADSVNKKYCTAPVWNPPRRLSMYLSPKNGWAIRPVLRWATG